MLSRLYQAPLRWRGAVAHIPRPPATFTPPPFLPIQNFRGHPFDAIAGHYRRQFGDIAGQHQNNPLLCGPWLKAARGKFLLDDFHSFCLDSSPHVPAPLHRTLTGAIFLPAINANMQGTIESNGKLKQFVVNALAQRPIAIQTINDVFSLAATLMAVDKRPTLVQIVQFLAAQAKLICTAHQQIHTTPPVMLGFTKPAQHLSQPNTPPVIFGTSIPTFADVQDPNTQVRDSTREYMKRILAEELRVAFDKPGRCVEIHTFLGYRDSMRNHTEMESLVFSVNTLISKGFPLRIADALLAATTDEQILNILRRYVSCAVVMCTDCKRICAGMNGARVIDLASVIHKKSPEEILSTLV